MVWPKMLFAIVILSSCRTYEPVASIQQEKPPTLIITHSASLEVIPHRVLMAPGMVVFVYVTVFDQEGNPLANKEVKAVLENPAVATLDKEHKLTDANGKAVFTLTGIAFPEITTLTFYVDGLSYTIEVDGFSASIS